MFTLSSRARALEERIRQLQRQLLDETLANQLLQKKWNELVRRINEKGGEQFLREGRIVGPSKNQFSPDDLRRLLQLCHPDKHNGSALAVEMTAKINKARS